MFAMCADSLNQPLDRWENLKHHETGYSLSCIKPTKHARVIMNVVLLEFSINALY